MFEPKAAVADSQIAALLSRLENLQDAVAQLPRILAELNRIAEILAPEQQGQTEPVPVEKWPVYLREWRESRAQSLEAVGRAIGLSRGQLSRIETGKQPYNQNILEGYSQCLDCRPSDLISHPPTDPDRAMRPLLLQIARMPESPRGAGSRKKVA